MPGDFHALWLENITKEVVGAGNRAISKWRERSGEAAAAVAAGAVIHTYLMAAEGAIDHRVTAVRACDEQHGHPAAEGKEMLRISRSAVAPSPELQGAADAWEEDGVAGME